MHQRLDGLPRTVVLDTNVLLNACFVGRSAAATAVPLLATQGFFPVLDSLVESEARRQLIRISTEESLDFDPIPILESYIATNRLLWVRTTRPGLPDGINNADRHVVHAAIEHGGWLLTNDFNLARECAELPVTVRFPRDVILGYYETVERKSPPLEAFIHIAGFSADKGSIFARVSSGGMAIDCHGETPTVCDISNFGTLGFSSGTNTWTFSVPEKARPLISLMPRARSSSWIVCFSYQKEATGNRMAYTLRAAGGENKTAKTFGPLRDHSIPPKTLTIGHKVDNTCHLNGTLSSLVLANSPLGTSTWNALRSVPHACPSPFDRDTLRTSLRIMSRLKRRAEQDDLLRFIANPNITRIC